MRAAQARPRISILRRNYRAHNSSNQLKTVKAVHLIPDLSFQAQNNVTNPLCADRQQPAKCASEFPGSDCSSQ